QPQPIIMSDALASNRPSVMTSLMSLCNSHGRRQFVDVINHFPDEVELIYDLFELE
ncbi:MAG: transposase, partial [Shewanella sp.]|nr:transposase [Shewanella sp.]